VPLVFNVSHYREFNAEHHFEGNETLASVTLAFDTGERCVEAGPPAEMSAQSIWTCAGRTAGAGGLPSVTRAPP
jgi:hypothetical protein